MPLALLAFVAVAVYLGQTITLPPDLSEGALLVGHADRLARGERVHFELVEYYGPLAWELPVLAYRLAGSKVIGVHAYLALTRLAAVAATYLLVRRQVGRGPAALAALTATALLGMQWPFFNSPYAPHLALPVLLASWLLLGRGPRLAAAAGVLTGILLWLKISVGAFALAGGLLTEATLGGTGTSPGPVGTRIRLALIAGVCLVFHAFILRPFRAEYVVYFTLPLLLVGLSLGRGVLRASRGEGSAGDPRAAAAFVGGAAATWVVVLLAYFRPAEIAGYAAEQLATFRRLDYAAPFPRLFVAGTFGNFTRMGWTLLPWGVTALHAAALLRARSEGTAVDPRAARLATLSLLVSFVLHSRADEAHLFHAILPSVPALFTLGGVHLERLGEASRV
ncbi:MAG: hypothetical protein FJ104_09330, partial [Deltaproteobacteria bacterium]|nr:hypothetical protein [Deltaproteobacteria bacterium]